MYGLTTVTPTRRLAGYLTECWVKENIKSKQVIEKPYIFSFEDICLEIFQALQVAGKINVLLISAAESLLLLEKIIQASEQGAGLLKVTTTAKLVWQAWQNFSLWHCDFDKIEWYQEDTRAFYHWIQSYLFHLNQAGWVDRPGLIALIQSHLDDSMQFLNIAPTRKLELYAFDDIPPRQRLFFEYLQSIGWEITEAKLIKHEVIPKRYAFQTAETEFRATAMWAKNILERDPKSRVGIVIPELPRYRLMVEKIFCEAFEPDALLYSEKVVSEYYNISAGQPLNTIPIIHLALEKLSEFKPKKTKYFYTHWVGVINDFLNSNDWPGDRRLNSIEHQAIKQWVALLESFSKLDVLFEPTDYNSAYIKLRHLAQDIPFQPQSKIVKLHILGALEAAGQSFSHLWVTGLNDSDWPSLANPSPFLPMSLQKELNMPHATHQRQWDFAEKMSNRLIYSAQHVNLSYCKQFQNQSYTPSALILFYPELNYIADEVNVGLNIFDKIFESRALEYIDDKIGPVLELNRIPSSSKTLRLQAHCPFRAFAEMRLGLIDPMVPSLGLNLKDRGILTHRILDALWSQLKTQKILLSYSDEALNHLIITIIEQNISRVDHLQLGQKFWETERIRLQKLMFAWLSIEKKRNNFEVVAREAYYPIKIENMSLNVCIDRVDRNESNEYIVIDYKTGQVDLAGLLSESLLEPQLPLYCFNGSFLNIDGVLFGQVRGGGCRFVGLTQVPVSPEVKVISDIEWHTLLTNWEAELARLVLDFKSGMAAVMPVNPIKICRTCHLSSLCRIKESPYVG